MYLTKDRHIGGICFNYVEAEVRVSILLTYTTLLALTQRFVWNTACPFN